MTKGPDAFRTISEVSDELNIPQHVLRFWETRFSQIRPLKRSGGRRFYRPEDVALLRGIRHLLYGSGYTIRGVQRILKEQGIGYVQRVALHDGEAADGSFMTGTADFSASQDNDATVDEAWSAHADDLPMQPAADEPAASPETGAFGNWPAGNDGEAEMPASDPPWPGRAGMEPSPLAAADTNAVEAIDSVIGRYAPGPLSARPQRSAAARPETVDEDIIRPRYRLTGDTRDQLQTVLVELRECRRLLHGALSRQQD